MPYFCLHFSCEKSTLQYLIFRWGATSALAGFHTGPLSWWNWNWECWFCGGKKTGELRKTLGARREPSTNSIYILHRARIEPGPLSPATSPSLLPYFRIGRFFSVRKLSLHTNNYYFEIEASCIWNVNCYSALYNTNTKLKSIVELHIKDTLQIHPPRY